MMNDDAGSNKTGEDLRYYLEASFIIGDKYGYANTTVDQNFQRMLIDIFAFVL